MLELNSSSFLGAVTELRQMVVLTNVINRNATVENDALLEIVSHLERLANAVRQVGATLAEISAQRLLQTLKQQNQTFTYQNVATSLSEIESRFADHLGSVKLFALHANETWGFEPVEKLMEHGGNIPQDFRAKFPSISFETEEAAKCYVLGRSTATVFHCMRAMEIGIRILAKRIGIPNPVTVTDRNWGNILKSIRTKIDETWPSKLRLQGTEGAQMDSLYVTLDAVKNPWRNGTMHVDVIYAPHEAMHIMRCVAFFILELMKHADESILADTQS